METKSDKELVLSCLGGAPDAWSAFIDKFSSLVYWAIKRKLNRYCPAYLKSDAEDLYQRVFALLWEKRSLEAVKDRDNISPWLIVLASNLATDFVRKKKREEDFLQEELAKEIPPIDDYSSVLIKEKRDILDKAMGILTEKERAYLELSYFSGKKHKEIADTFNVPMNSVSTIIARAKTKIKRFISKKIKI
ncbi:MAG: sigma-70 family RNA polymerase sigma factor [Candidatus Omnitrophica bacterium]|nr:sigma-70 family RNA polymerase sigma factor [Candidatus Omnitrophota bacterium]